MLPEKLTDWRGNDYGVGDIVLYATSQSSSVEMHEGVVLEILEEKKYTWRHEQNQIVWDEESEKVLALRVQPTKAASSYSTSTTAWRDTPFKPVTLRVLNRVTFLERGA